MGRVDLEDHSKLILRRAILALLEEPIPNRQVLLDVTARVRLGGLFLLLLVGGLRKLDELGG
jgi:hypothetical protein